MATASIRARGQKSGPSGSDEGRFILAHGFLFSEIFKNFGVNPPIADDPPRIVSLAYSLQTSARRGTGMARQRSARTGSNRGGRSQTPHAPLRVFVVTDVALYREGLARVLARERSVSVVGTGAPDQACLRAIAASRPRIVLVDDAGIRKAGFVGEAAAAAQGGSIIALGVTDEPEVLVAAEAGVAGYIADDASTRELCEGMQHVTAGQFPCPASVAKVLLRHVDRSTLPRDRKRFDRGLTAREHDIVRLLDRGLTNKEIAVALSIEIATVKNHVHHILEKLGVARRAAAAAKVREPEDSGPAGRSFLS